MDDNSPTMYSHSGHITPQPAADITSIPVGHEAGHEALAERLRPRLLQLGRTPVLALLRQGGYGGASRDGENEGQKPSSLAFLRSDDSVRYRTGYEAPCMAT